MQNFKKEIVSNSNELVRAIEDYEIANEKKVHAEGALYASFVILYGKTRDKNVLELVSMSGLTTPEKFLEDFPTYEWFFIEGRDLTEREKTLACFGGYAGDFLIRIKSLD